MFKRKEAQVADEEKKAKEPETTIIESRIIRGTDYTVRAGILEHPDTDKWYATWIDLPYHKGSTTYRPGGVYMTRERAILAADAMVRGFVTYLDINLDQCEEFDGEKTND